MRLIEGNNITIGYEGEPVLSGLSFTVNEGDYLCIVGENGSGKSTFIKTKVIISASSVRTDRGRAHS